MDTGTVRGPFTTIERDRLPASAEPPDADLPEGWVRTKLPEIADIVMGQSPPGSTYNDQGEGLPFFQGKADYGPRYPRVRVWCSAPQKIAEPGDVLISVRAPVGPTNVADHRCAIGRGLAAIRPLGSVPTDFILHTLRMCEAELAAQGTGTTFTAISRANLDAIDVDLPPLAEQERIVEAVDALLTALSRSRERLLKVPAILKRFRQAVLAAACSGRLTADWRAGQPAMIPPTDLVDALRVRLRVAHPVLHPPTDAYDDDMPDSWVGVSIGELVRVATGATPLRKQTTYYDGGTVPWVKSSSVNLPLITHADEFITERALHETNAKVFPPGTLLVAMYGEGATRGKVAELGFAAATNQALAALLFDDLSAPMRPYLKIALQSQYVKNREISAGGVQPNLSIGAVKTMRVPVPPLAEQQEIVRRVAALFGLADAIERRVAAAQARADKLTQAILAKAFRGELVPTEAELARREGRVYEPAAALLARIQAARAQDGVADSSRKRGNQDRKARRRA